MNKKYIKDFAILAGVIVFSALAARHFAGNETLEDYARKHPEAASAVWEESVTGPDNERVDAAKSEHEEAVESENIEATSDGQVTPSEDKEPSTVQEREARLGNGTGNRLDNVRYKHAFIEEDEEWLTGSRITAQC